MSDEEVWMEIWIASRRADRDPDVCTKAADVGLKAFKERFRKDDTRTS